MYRITISYILDNVSDIWYPPHWPPIIIKATYVFGIIHDICESVDWLLKAPNAWPVTYYSAFGVCASAIEILGCCINGDSVAGKTKTITSIVFRNRLHCVTSQRTAKPRLIGLASQILNCLIHFHSLLAMRWSAIGTCFNTNPRYVKIWQRRTSFH